jgi:DMSO reductase family type II enzyme heme b subunit
LFAATCASCHGATGKGDGVQAQKNDDGTPTRPRDLTRGIFKGSRDAKQLYARIMLGMPGSPMPGSNQTIKPEGAGDLVNFLLSLSSPQTTESVEHRRTALTARRVAGIPASATDAGWDGAAKRIVVSPLWWRDHDDPEFQVAAVHDGKTLAIRLSWRDPTKNTEVSRPEDFLDMAAVQLCSAQPEPFLGMGAAKGQVDLWLWRGGTLARPVAVRGPLDEYPFQSAGERAAIKGGKPPDALAARAAGNPNTTSGPNSSLAARGAGSTTFLPPASQLVTASGEWKDGRWTVVLRRPLQVPDDSLSLMPGKSCSAAFAVWDGAHRDRNGQKFVSIWHDLKVEE